MLLKSIINESLKRRVMPVAASAWYSTDVYFRFLRDYGIQFR